MLRLLTPQILLVLSLFASVAEARQGPMLTPDQVARDVALAQEAYDRIHPGYTRYAEAATLDAAWQQVVDDAQTAGGLSTGDFYLAVQRVLTLIRCDHTKAELPKALATRRREQATYLPFQWVLVEGRGFVTVAAEATGLKRGDEILRIDGRPLPELVAEVAPYIPVDGYTDWARRGGISNSREFMGGALDHFGDLLWDNGPTVALALADENGETREVTLDRLTFGDWRALDADTGRAANFVDAVTFEPIGDNAGYLRIDTFVNYRRPVDPDDLYGPIFKRLADEGRDTLILDLRNNGGGSNDASSRLIAHLLDQPAQMKTDVRVKTLNLDGLREHLSTWDKRALNPWRIMFRKNRDGSYSFRGWFTDETDRIKPARHAFTGKLLILTSDENSSGSTNVIAVLAGLGRATLIGEPTGGSAEGTTAGILFTLTMPESGIRTRIPAIRDYNNVPSFEAGLGVTPDIKAPMTAADWRAGNDVALIAAKALIAR
ncbi:MAG: S41 family peptidase [Pseudomonadota bacterium]